MLSIIIVFLFIIIFYNSLIFSEIINLYKLFLEELQSRAKLFLQRKIIYKQYETNIPIVLIHGHYGKPSNFNYIIKELEVNKIGPIYTPKLSNSDIPTQAAELKQFIDNNNLKNIIIIGASLGGIVGAYYTEYHSNGTVLKIITIATPFQGTKLAHVLVPELDYKSPILMSLFEKIIKSPKYLSITSLDDFMIVPYTSAVLPQTIMLKKITHNGLLFDKSVAKLIIDNINKGGET